MFPAREEREGLHRADIRGSAASLLAHNAICLRFGYALLAFLLSVSTGLGQDSLRLPTGGINLGPYNYFERSQPFVDYAKMSTGWQSTDGNIWSDNRPLVLGPTGYPTELAEDQFARSLIFTHNGEFYPTGTYSVTWEGTGVVALRSPNNTATELEVFPRSATYEVHATNQQGLLLEIRETDPDDPVRNVRVFETAAANFESPFQPEYTADLEPYGVLRFMDWNQTNYSDQVRWGDRTRVNDAFWGGINAIPYERQIQLSNELKQDLWINVPHAAGNHYVRQLATLIQETLDPELRVWVEYTNEYWNPLFFQNSYIQTELTSRYGVSGQTHAYALRSSEIFDVFAEEFDRERTIRVFGAWGSVLFPMWAGLPHITDEEGNTNADVTAIAAYFDLPPEKMEALYQDYLAGNPIDRDQVFADLRADIDTNSELWRQNREISSEYGLPMVAYEAGQHIVPRTAEQKGDEGFLQLLYSINRDERMGETYEYLFEKWRSIGGSTLNFYNNMSTWHRDGMWGLREGFYDVDNPKRQAVDDYLASNPAGYDAENMRWVGDLDGNGMLDVGDIDEFTSRLYDGTATSNEDLNLDGVVDIDDREYFLNDIMRVLPGDADLDGEVSTTDLIFVFESGEYEDLLVGNSTWGSGDWNGDREFNSQDFVYILSRGAFTTTAANVPEPAQSPLMLSLLLLIVARRLAGSPADEV